MNKLTGSDETEVLPEAMLFNLLIIFIFLDTNHNTLKNLNTHKSNLKKKTFFFIKNKREKHKNERKKHSLSLSCFSLLFLSFSFFFLLFQLFSANNITKMKPKTKQHKHKTNLMNPFFLSLSKKWVTGVS